MTYTRENPPPGAMWRYIGWLPEGSATFWRVRDGTSECWTAQTQCWNACLSISEEALHYSPVLERIGEVGRAIDHWASLIKPADPNEAMLARDGQPTPKPTPPTPAHCTYEAPRSDGLLTLAPFGQRNVWGA